jgi:hypothetical protein
MAGSVIPFAGRFRSPVVAEVIAHLTQPERARFLRLNSTDLALKGLCLLVSVFLLFRGLSELFGHQILQGSFSLLLWPAWLGMLWSAGSIKRFLRSTDYAKSRRITFVKMFGFSFAAVSK